MSHPTKGCADASSIDFTVNSCSSTGDATFLTGLIAQYAKSSAQATYSGKPLVSTFSGDGCTFGQSSATSGWAYLRTLLKQKGTDMYLVPAIFVDPATFSSMPWLDGEFNWNSGWPMRGAPLDTSSDKLYMGDLGNRTYLPAISPFFFTYYGPNSYNKDWIYRSDDWLYARRWEQVALMRNVVDFAEIISWNGEETTGERSADPPDYGESHYIGPIRDVQPQWTIGMPHSGSPSASKR